MGERLWITWEKQRRNRTLSNALGAVLCEFSLELPRIIKHPYLVLLTAIKIINVKPSILFVQNPSMVLSFFAVFFSKLIRIPVVVDAHNSGVFPFGGKVPWATKLCKIINKNATYVIVSNNHLVQHVNDSGGRAIVLPDPIPEISVEKTKNKSRNDIFEVLFVCTWSPDEPYMEVIKAAGKLDSTIKIYITGNSRRAAIEDMVKNYPANIVLTGYLPDDEYEKLLSSVDVVMDLTTFDDCLVCGAYESVAAEKPIILSNNTASREYFNKGVVHVENNEKDILRGIYEAKNEIQQLEDEIVEFHKLIKKQWSEQLREANRKFEIMEKKEI